MVVSNLVSFHPYLGIWSNLTCAYFSNGFSINHQLDASPLGATGFSTTFRWVCLCSKNHGNPSYPPPPKATPLRNSRPYSGFINHWFPLIGPAIKPLIPGGGVALGGAPLGFPWKKKTTKRCWLRMPSNSCRPSVFLSRCNLLGCFVQIVARDRSHHEFSCIFLHVYTYNIIQHCLSIKIFCYLFLIWWFR